MNSKLLKILKLLISFFLGGFIGFQFCYHIIAEVVAIYFPNSPIFYYTILGFCIICGMLLINLILSKQIDSRMFKLIAVAYLCFLFVILFGRETINSVFIINPISSIKDLTSPEMILQSILNLIMFVPLGYIFKNVSFKTTFIISFLISILIELAQGIFHLGIFDSLDIILYVVGIILGRALSKKWKFDIK